MLEEISNRLDDLVKVRAPTLFDKLKPALDLADRQLEGMCPALMGMSRKGFVGTLVAQVPRGTWLIVLANPRKVFTLYTQLPPPPNKLHELIDYCVEQAVEQIGHIPVPGELCYIMNLVINKHGGKPNTTSPALEQAICMQILGLLFASQTERHDLFDAVEQTIAGNVCPLHVGLVGKGSKKNTWCGVWPLGLGFAPYAEHVMDDLDQ